MGRTRTRAAARIVLDAGALIALDRGDKRMVAFDCKPEEYRDGTGHGLRYCTGAIACNSQTEARLFGRPVRYAIAAA